jgi:ubiquinone/menaquinone biosynthesis C-methylase UbiE
VKLRRAGRHWEALAKQDPLWAVLSYDEKRGNRWDVDEFFATGVWEIEEALKAVAELGVAMNTRKALDFGCGVGRLTQAMADHFDEVWGVDIAPSMIELAERYNRHPGACHFVVNAASDLKIFDDATFGFVYSNIVLQHVEPTYQLRYMDELVRVLMPGGALVFQLPSERAVTPHPAPQEGGLKETLRSALPVGFMRRYRDTRRDISNVGKGPRFEMWATPKAEVTTRLEKHGAKVLAADQDDSAGQDWISYRYIVTR